MHKKCPNNKSQCVQHFFASIAILFTNELHDTCEYCMDGKTEPREKCWIFFHPNRADSLVTPYRITARYYYEILSINTLLVPHSPSGALPGDGDNSMYGANIMYKLILSGMVLR